MTYIPTTFNKSASRCTQQGRQREPSVKILRSPFSAEFFRLCVLSGAIQRRALPRYESNEIKILSPRVGIESKTVALYLQHDGTQKTIRDNIYFLFTFGHHNSAESGERKCLTGNGAS